MMWRPRISALFYPVALIIGCSILAGCGERFLILKIHEGQSDSVEHYAICVQVGNIKYDLFRIPGQITKLIIRNPADAFDTAEARLSIRAIGADAQVLGSGSASSQWSGSAPGSRVEVALKYFPAPYKISSQPGFSLDPQHTQSDIAWYGVWLTEGGDEGWAVGADVFPGTDTARRPKIARYAGGRWQLMADEALPNSLVTQDISLNAVWGKDRDHVWAVGNRGTTISWDGNRWSDISKDNSCVYLNNLFGVWGMNQLTESQESVDSCQPWVVGDNGTVSCFNGRFWDCSKSMPLPAGRIASLRKLWGSSSSDVWVVGGYLYCVEPGCPAYELILKRVGGRWVEVRRDNTEYLGYLTGISGIDKDHIWAVKDTAEILVLDSGSWQPKQPLAQNANIDFSAKDSKMKNIYGFNAVWMGAHNDVWISMYNGSILHWHKNSAGVETWLVSGLQSTQALLALSGSDSCNMLLAGHVNYLGVYLPDAPATAR